MKSGKLFKHFATVVAIVLVVILAGFPASANEERERAARGLYVEAAKILRDSDCPLFSYMFGMGSAIARLADLGHPSDKATFADCVEAYRPAARIYDRILDEYSDTVIAVKVVEEGRVGTKRFDKLVALAEEWSKTQEPNTSISAPTSSGDAPSTGSLSFSEIETIRRQIERCWLVPTTIGANDVDKMKVEIGMKLNPDGSLRSARIVDQFRFETNPTYREIAETALRAVRNPRCSTFDLPPDKYEIWKNMIVMFDPSEMVGR